MKIFAPAYETSNLTKTNLTRVGIYIEERELLLIKIEEVMKREIEEREGLPEIF